MPKFFAGFIFGLFLCALWLPVLDEFLRFDPYPTPFENRRPVPPPAWPATRREVEQFPKNYERYRNDHFGLRNGLLHSYCTIKNLLLKSSSSRWVLIGKNRWLFLSERSALNGFSGERPLTDDQLEGMLRVTRERVAWCRERNMLYGSWWVPDKHLVYAKQLPDWVQPIHSPSNMIRWAQYARREGEGAVHTLLPVLLEARNSGQVYFRADSHWNSQGAFAGYRAIMDSLRSEGLHTRIIEREDLQVIRVPEKADLAMISNIGGFYQDYINKLRPKGGVTASSREWLQELEPEKKYQVSNPNQELPKLVIFGDSFCFNLLPFLAESFSEILYARDQVFSPDIIEQQQPDVVLELFVSRQMETERPMEALPVPEWRQ